MEEVLFEDIARRVFKIVRLTPEEEEKFLESDVAKACTMAPYICDSVDADRYAITNALIFIAAIKDATFHARPEDFIMWPSLRISHLFDFPGDVRKMAKLQSRLAEREFNDYKADMVRDSESGKYNPIVAGDVPEHRESPSVLASQPDVNIDTIFTLEQAQSAFWWPDP